MNNPQLRISADELPRLLQTMQDIQDTVAVYYAETAKGGEPGGHVRTWLSRVQTLNDLLAKQIADRTQYNALFGTPVSSGAELINAVKYARNVDQHLMYIVEPRSDTLIGGSHGPRFYAHWQRIPAATHAKLHRGTQGLQPAYQARLEGQDVTATMLAVLRFFADLAPQIVHRDQRGEWSGFPLMNHPGVRSPLHPEEPVEDTGAANEWLNNRRPNGDLRVVCGQITQDGTAYLVGFTFVGRLSFSPFVETIDQVERDIAAGFLYLRGDAEKNLRHVGDKFPSAQGSVLQSSEEVSIWATPLINIKSERDWIASTDAGSWARMITLERSGVLPDFKVYELRRARRLNALVPPR